MRDTQRKTLIGLPYINTWQGVVITLVINLLVIAVLYWCGAIDERSFVFDAFNCGFITSIISVAIAYPQIKRIRLSGGLPRIIEEGHALRKLPSKPAPLALVLGLLIGILMTGIAIAVKWFFEIQIITPLRFLVWKLVYATLLSVKTTELVVLRLVQQDCAVQGEPVQNGTAIVKNPLPRKETFANLLHTVTEDFGFNLLVGLLLGGTVIHGHDVIIPATTRAGIVIGGLVLGAIVTFRMIYPVAKSICSQREAGGLHPFEKQTAVAILPARPIYFAFALLLPTMLLTAAVLWAVLTFFGFEELNFFQYFVVRTVYVTLLSKLIVLIAVLRYSQPEKNPATQTA